MATPEPENRTSRFYAVEHHTLDRLHALALRLYSEQRMDADQMRDAAQMLDGIVEQARNLEITEGTP